MYMTNDVWLWKAIHGLRKNIQLFIRSKVIFWLSPYLYILCIILDKPYYIETAINLSTMFSCCTHFAENISFEILCSNQVALYTAHLPSSRRRSTPVVRLFTVSGTSRRCLVAVWKCRRWASLPVGLESPHCRCRCRWRYHTTLKVCLTASRPIFCLPCRTLV